jgi:CubicO group peptidase (beta-lactamase class C family)
MTRSTTRAAVVETRENVASSHIQVDGRVHAVPRRNYDNIGGAGAVFSSAWDMAQWVRLQLGGGEFEGRRLLEAETVREMHTPHTVIRGDSVLERLFPTTNFRAYGLGWILQDHHGRKLVQHSGSINWTRTQVGMIPAERVGVVVIANLNTSNLQLAVMHRVLDGLLGLPPRDWSAEYLELARRADERAAASRHEVEAARVTGTRPSLDLERYAGVYTSDLFGEMRLSLDGNRLVIDYAPDYVADVEHWHHDTFRANWRRTGFGHAFVTFALDARGRIATMNVDGLGEFRRTPD